MAKCHALQFYREAEEVKGVEEKVSLLYPYYSTFPASRLLIIPFV
jgi:hypothetical protein